MPKTYIVFTDAESAFLRWVAGEQDAHADSALSAGTLRAAILSLAQSAGYGLPEGAFLPRQRGAHLRQVSREKKSAAAKKRWQAGDPEARKHQGAIMRAARKRAKTKKGDD